MSVLSFPRGSQRNYQSRERYFELVELCTTHNTILIIIIVLQQLHCTNQTSQINCAQRTPTTGGWARREKIEEPSSQLLSSLVRPSPRWQGCVVHNFTNSKCLSCDWQFHLLLRGNDKTVILRLRAGACILLFFWILPRLCLFNFNNMSLHLSCWFSFVRPRMFIDIVFVSRL